MLGFYFRGAGGSKENIPSFSCSFVYKRDGAIVTESGGFNWE